MQINSNSLETLIEELPNLSHVHSPHSDFYENLSEIAKRAVSSVFGENRSYKVTINPFGEVILPYQKMGAIDSLDLWGIDEIILFSFYVKNRHIYKRVMDIGANIGLHSILLSKLGYEVVCYEPDPSHFDILKRNLKLNDCESVRTEMAAVSDEEGSAEFTRVLGNTTGSHLSGVKEKCYGPIETFEVKVVDISKLLRNIDLVKIDVEGHESSLLKSIPKEAFNHLDVLLEVGSEKNAQAIYDQFKESGIHLFAQKINWERVTSEKSMPTSYKEGSLFISMKPEMPW